MTLERISLLAFFVLFASACDSGGEGPPSLPGLTGGGEESATTETPSDDVEEPGDDDTTDAPDLCVVDSDCAETPAGICETVTCDVASGECGVGPLETGTSCDDGIHCTINDGCTPEGTCEGEQDSCSDDDACTDDSCSEEEGCSSTKNTAECDDGDPCTLKDTCDDGDCFGEENLCDDDDPCTTGECSADSGECSFEFNTSFCDDGDPCSGNDNCLEGACAGTPLECDDNNSCTVDVCDPELGHCTQTFSEEPCGDDVPCETCNDDEPCTVEDVCMNGQCMGAPNPCEDDNLCTDDACTLGVGCVSTPNSNGCEDGDECTDPGTCTDGACVTENKSCNDGKVCTVDSCNALTGCSHELSSSLLCDDNDECTGEDICTNGSCGGTALTCDDGDICTDDICIKASGCDTTFNQSPCDDGDACTDADSCQQGVCAGSTLTCDDENPCTDDLCDSDTGCEFTANELECDDGNICTENDLCGENECVGTEVNCNDDNPCTNDVCEFEIIDSPGCIYEEISGTLCDDGSICTQDDLCVVGQCQGSYIPGCVTPVCGDDACTFSETCSSCPEDCGQCCGDDLCLAEETCLSCEADCGSCPPSFCDTELVVPYDFCGGDCNPIEGNGACDPNALCVPTIEEPAIGDVYNETAFELGNGACGDACAASFQCAQGSICVNTNGLIETGICAQTCEVGDDTICSEGTTCVANASSPTDGACLPGPSCETDDPDACAGLETNTCIQLKPGTTSGICLHGCTVQNLYGCGDNGVCILRDGTDWDHGTCVGYSSPCNPITHEGCNNTESCVAEGGSAYGGSTTHCVVSGFEGEGAECVATAGTCQSGMLCHEGACTVTCNPSSGSAGCSIGQECKDVSASFNVEASIEGYFLGICGEPASE